MILIASEASSLATKASFWELAEYVSEALVGLGCLGEYVAEYAKWPAAWTSEQRHRLGRRSLILLIAGIGAGVVSLIQTNGLSGKAIGSLGEQIAKTGKNIESVDKVSSAALEVASKAGVASEHAAKVAKDATVISDVARITSDKAIKTAGSAETLARSAHREADSFEKDIASAKQDLTALRRETEDERIARIELAKSLTWPTLDFGLMDTIATPLKRFAGQRFAIVSEGLEIDRVKLLIWLMSLLSKAEWNRNTEYANPNSELRDIGSNVFVWVTPKAPASVSDAAKALVSVLNRDDIDLRATFVQVSWGPIPDAIPNDLIRVVIFKRGPRQLWNFTEAPPAKK